jgi:hypothetical protein
VLILDEIQEYATEDLAVALTLGRELKLFTVIAHQFPSQLKLGASDSHLFEAVEHCCRTKIVFGGMHVRELKEVVEEIVIDQFDPYYIKDQRRTLIVEPIETTREVVTRGSTTGGSLGMNTGTSSATARGQAHGVSWQSGASHSHSDASSLLHSSGVNSGVSEGESLLPNGDIIAVAHTTEGMSEVDAKSTTTSDSYGGFEAEGQQDTTSTSESQGKQTSFGVTLNHSQSESRSIVPFLEPKKHWDTNPTFLQLEEFLTMCLQKIKALPRGHFVLKVPDRKAVFVRANFIRVPWVSCAMRAKALERMHHLLSPPAAKPAPVPYQLPAPMVELQGVPPPPDFFGE